MAEIDSLPQREISSKAAGVVQDYIQDYLPFHKRLVLAGISFRSLDKALWAFGKFIKRYPHFGALK